jgi:hypothetical protein
VSGEIRSGEITSGDPIVIVSAPGADVTRFVDSLAWFPADLPDWVLIGGVAVVLRVGAVHRATIDIDTLTREPKLLVEGLTAHGGERRAGRFVVPTETQLDVIDVGTIADRTGLTNRELAATGREHAFSLAKDWAFNTAVTEAVRIEDPRGNVLASASLRLATVCGLIALKVVSIPQRAEGMNPAKVISDTLDLLALAQAQPLDELISTLDTSPVPLQEWMAATCQRVFIDELRYTEARLRATRANVAPGAIALLARLSARLG